MARASFGAAASFAPETAITRFAAPDVGNVREALGVSEAQAEAVLEQGFLTGQLSATAAIGAYVLLAGAVLAVVGGIAGLGLSGVA